MRKIDMAECGVVEDARNVARERRDGKDYIHRQLGAGTGAPLSTPPFGGGTPSRRRGASEQHHKREYHEKKDDAAHFETG
jgi:hypothetical protein